ncbi:MAG: hypothetical protein MUP19_02010 [Candidatus Aminicenantes bacterium]|nr:hypothetical protein [Candidatus Aminicenantes bacterium]
MKGIVSTSLVIVSLLLLLAACGGSGQKTESASAAAEPAVEPQQESKPAPPDNTQAGVELAQEILAACDQAVDASLALAKDKPEAAVLKPQLSDLLEQAKPRMLEFNARYRDLQDKNAAAFAAAHRTLGENRPQHVTNMYNVLHAVYVYYNFEKGEQEIVQLLSSEIVKLIDIAIQLEEN